MRILAIALAFLLVALPSFAAGPRRGAKKKGPKDSAPPVIEHEPVRTHDGIGPILVEAKITDALGKVYEPALLVRAKGTGMLQRVPLAPVEGKPDLYGAQIPNELLTNDVEYVLEAFDEDGNGPARVGDEALPLLIKRDVPAQETDTTSSTSNNNNNNTNNSANKPNNANKVPEDEGVSPALVVTGVVVGAIVVLGAAAGTGFAIYALRPPAPNEVRVTISGPSPVSAQ